MPPRDVDSARDLTLLSLEWQGHGVSSDVQRSTARLAAALLPNTGVLRVDAPMEERLQVDQRVLGLSSIADRLGATLEALDDHRPDRIFHLGGTCGAELAPVAYLNRHCGGDLAVVWFDAHGDLNTPASSPSAHFHGMVLRTLCGDGPAALTSLVSSHLNPAQVFLAGTRELDPAEQAFIDATGISVTTCEELERPQTLVSRIRSAGFTRVYAHLDLDVLDPTVFPHSLMQTPGGIAPDVASTAIRALDDAFDLVGFSIVEYVERSPKGIDQVRSLLANTGAWIG